MTQLKAMSAVCDMQANNLAKELVASSKLTRLTRMHKYMSRSIQSRFTED